MKFKETSYGDISNEIYTANINVNNKKLTSLEGSPKIINGNFSCRNNNLTTLKNSPLSLTGFFDCRDNDLKSLDGNLKLIKGEFDCRNNKNLKNIKEEIKKHKVKAYKYLTDEGDFYFNDIKKEFLEYHKEIEKNKYRELNYEF